jgi:hypothetical protein
MDERRSDVRARSLLRGRIIFNQRGSTMDCVIRNLSATGARIVMGETVVVPKEFELSIPQKGTTYRARLRWRTATEFGVEFLPCPAGQMDQGKMERLEGRETT